MQSSFTRETGRCGGLQHTIYIWPEGLFPRRAVYYVILKGLVSSPQDLLAAKTTVPNLSINVCRFSLEAMGFQSETDLLDPLPIGMSLPCLRISDPSKPDVLPRYIHESTSILGYLEDVFNPVEYPQFPSLRGTSPLDVALASDLQAIINETIKDASYYMRHSSKRSLMWSKLPFEHRNRAAGENGKMWQRLGLEKLQRWAKENGGLDRERGGWLMSGTRPGIVDASLAAWLKYTNAVWDLNLLEGKGLEELQDWWNRIKSERWYAQYEALITHPETMRFGSADLEF